MASSPISLGLLYRSLLPFHGVPSSLWTVGESSHINRVLTTNTVKIICSESLILLWYCLDSEKRIVLASPTSLPYPFRFRKEALCRWEAEM